MYNILNINHFVIRFLPLHFAHVYSLQRFSDAKEQVLLPVALLVVLQHGVLKAAVNWGQPIYSPYFQAKILAGRGTECCWPWSVQCVFVKRDVI